MRLPPIQPAGFAERDAMKTVWKRFPQMAGQMVHTTVHLIQNL